MCPTEPQKSKFGLTWEPLLKAQGPHCPREEQQHKQNPLLQEEELHKEDFFY